MACTSFGKTIRHPGLGLDVRGLRGRKSGPFFHNSPRHSLICLLLVGLLTAFYDQSSGYNFDKMDLDPEDQI